MPQQEEIFEEDETKIIEEDGTELIDVREEFEEVKGTAGGEGGTVG